MKQLKFESNLADLILRGKKTSTWRLFDDKDLKTGDVLEFLRKPENTAFAQAMLTKVYEKKIKDIMPEDMQGHEKYTNNSELIRTFKDYYGEKVNEESFVKIIHFQIL